jgi:hypothetical protein
LLVELPRSFSPLNPATLGWVGFKAYKTHTHKSQRENIYFYSRNLNM